MKIICIGRNYVDHAKELKNPVPKQPVFFMKPDSALVLKNRPFFYPEFSSDVHHELELVIRIQRLGRSIPEKFASRYYNEVALGVDFTARDLQAEMKKKGLPWEIAKGFDYSAPVSDFVPLPDPTGKGALDFYLDLNGKTVQKGTSNDMIFSFDQIVAYVSRFMTLKTGDLIFTGTPAGVGPVQINDHLECYLQGRKMMDFYVK
ncbi:MAG: fumarylacetoacetate hydrolase family protein [Bacteroidales bacterium]|nr:fumarylacetoacetate hydrolase family protein [Bacteroidales bacterium]MDT8431221.1 fumarylacetoacetate hydrolase family protein [Bacteroidales bacterium]